MASWSLLADYGWLAMTVHASPSRTCLDLVNWTRMDLTALSCPWLVLARHDSTLLAGPRMAALPLAAPCLTLAGSLLAPGKPMTGPWLEVAQYGYAGQQG